MYCVPLWKYWKTELTTQIKARKSSLIIIVLSTCLPGDMCESWGRDNIKQGVGWRCMNMISAIKYIYIF